ncbi:hypothetical protein KEM60_00682 [Austwickia sp. TVS 96-490-7B]|uniref:HAAS signaling domain-containing protein n=1 Tax=Austwickia sp. TVS 96-490-7B TaxID=2830843 RepID=UPI001C55BAD8|nr:hypothetical protein [Austwickia sp. TVS 96-490-7B]MBW3084494.1 hypothetical protein [Austwickia sp. TVS 96-490-7B]
MMIGSTASLRENYPHVDPEWMEALLLALRMKEVPGSRIGDHLEQVESHCADSGQNAAQAFGDPREYAAQLCVEDHPGPRRQMRRRDVLVAIGAVMGFQLALWSDKALLVHGAVHVRVAQILIALALVALLCAAVFSMEWILTHLRTAVAIIVLFTAVQVGLLLWGGPLLAAAPPIPLAALGWSLMILCAVRWTRDFARADDVIVRPGRAPRPTERVSARLVSIMAAWMLPSFAMTDLILTWALGR